MKKKITVYLSIIILLLGMISTIEPLKAYADGGVVIKLHYSRPDGDYAPWSVWFWAAGKDGNDYSFNNEDGEMVASFEPEAGTTSVGFIVRTQEWAKDWDADQFIDISEMVSGTVHIYVESGIEGFTKEYGDDVVKGIKLKNAKYDGNGTITVTMTEDIDDFDAAFSVRSKEADIEIGEVTAKGNGIYEIAVQNLLDNFKNYFITYEGTEYKINMKNIYSTDEFEKEFTYTGTDLGAIRSSDKTDFRVWAPTAESVSLNLYEGGDARMKDLIETIDMKKDVNGTWVVTVNRDLNGKYYTYTAVHDGKKQEACDPYAVSTGVNGDRAMVLDLASTNPEGWEQDTNPNAGLKFTDAIIYEAHIRDLTAGDTGVTNKGKYLGVVEAGTASSNGIPTGLDHMKDLGITHLHVLPMYDFGSVDELKSVTDIYNWGYDPVNYNVPEGSYSTNAQDGAVRVREVKEMVKGLHDNGISVVMDVVYNHVYNAEKFCFNKLVPGYFSRVTDEGTYSNGSGCGNDTASERSMVKKYIVESVNYWADEYHIDGFRFDLVGLLDIDTINEIVSTVHEKHPDVIFYGEGWTMTTLTTKENVVMATQVNSESTPGFAYFNDTIRDGIKGSVFDKGAGFVSGAMGYEAKIARCFLGADNWCVMPSQTVNYASCHDNNTLIDRLSLSRPEASREDLIKMNNLSAAIYMLSEGIPFMQAGEEMLRSKVNADGSYNENSYNAGDTVNAIDYSVLADSQYMDVYDYYKGLIAFRKEHPVFRLESADEVERLVHEVKLGMPQTVAFEINGDLEGESGDALFVVYNAGESEATVTLPEGDWNVCIKGNIASTESLEIVNGTVSVEPISALVLVKGNVSNETIDSQPSNKKGFATKAIVAGAALAALAGVAFTIFKKKK